MEVFVLGITNKPQYSFPKTASQIGSLVVGKAYGQGRGPSSSQLETGLSTGTHGQVGSHHEITKVLRRTLEQHPTLTHKLL
jgi:hypothetical protein